MTGGPPLLLRPILYRGRVLRRALKDTVAAFGWWTLIGPLLLGILGVVAHFALVRWFPLTKAVLGEPMTEWWINVVYVFGPLGMVTAVVAVCNVLLAPSRIYWEQQEALAKFSRRAMSLTVWTRLLNHPTGPIYGAITLRNESDRRLENVRVKVADVQATGAGRAKRQKKAENAKGLFIAAVPQDDFPRSRPTGPPNAFSLNAGEDILLRVIALAAGKPPFGVIRRDEFYIQTASVRFVEHGWLWPSVAELSAGSYVIKLAATAETGEYQEIHVKCGRSAKGKPSFRLCDE